MRSSTTPRAPSTGARTSTRRARLACDFTGKHPEITHTRFGALRLKDAHLRSAARYHRQPARHRDRPSGGARARACERSRRSRSRIDLSGEGLHRRGYRAQAGEAPLRENLAAGILLRAGWPEKCAAAARIPRSDVRLGHARDRSGDDRGERRARSRAATTSDSSAGWGTTAPRGNGEARRAGARATAGASRCAGSMSDGSRARGRARERGARGRRVRSRPSTTRRAARRAAGETRGPGIPRHQPAVRRAPRRSGRGARADESSSAACCASTSRAGMPRSSPARPMRDSSWDCAPSACTRSGTARSNAGCCACMSPRRPRSRCCTPAQRAHRRERSRSRRARRCSATASRRTSSSSRAWATARARELLPPVRRRHARVFVRHRPVRRGRRQRRVWLYVQEYARAENHRARSGATPAQRGAGGAAGCDRHCPWNASTCASGARSRAATSTRS